MSDDEPPPAPASAAASRILVIDLRGERGEVLQAMLEPLGDVALTSRLAPVPGTPSLIVVDPPAAADAAAYAGIAEALAGRPVLVLGAAPDSLPVARLLGPVVPSRLLAAAREASRSPPREDWTEGLARALPLLPADFAFLARARGAGIPVLLAGEPGTGKSLVARTLLAPLAGEDFHHLELGRGHAVAARLGDLPDAALAYLSGLEQASPAEQAALVLHLDRRRAARLVLAAHSPEALAPLRDDLRLRLAPFVLEIPPLRRRRDVLVTCCGRVLAVLAARYRLPLPDLGEDARRALLAHAWPLNFEELVSCATRALFRAASSPLGAGDLGLAPARGRESRDGLRPGTSQPRALEALVQELAHEIKNPLVSIKTFTQLLGERFEDADFRDQYYRIVSDDVDRIDAVLTELSEFTRLREPSWEAVDVAAIVQRVLDNHRFLARKRSVEVVTRDADRPSAARADVELVAYALDALVREALGSVLEGGTLEASLVAGDEHGPERSLRLVVRYPTATAADEDGAAAAPAPREALGLRHTLARSALDLVGATLAVEDSLDGETTVTVKFHA